MKKKKTKVALFSGGVGGAKMAESISFLPDTSLKILSNVADDDYFHGLYVSPDIDTLVYTLSGKVNKKSGWGVKNDSFKALETLQNLGNQSWMNLGDYDLGLHIFRTNLLNKGYNLSEITSKIVQKFNIMQEIIVPTNDPVRTRILSEKGWLSFQEFFVRERCKTKIFQIKFQGINKARVTNDTIKTINEADLILFGPSNPIVSINPILRIKNIKKTVLNSKSIKVAVSPIVSGKAIKGPAKEMLISEGFEGTVYGVAKFYKDLIDVIIIDNSDYKYAKEIEKLNIKVICYDIVLNSKNKKLKLAKKIIDLV